MDAISTQDVRPARLGRTYLRDQNRTYSAVCVTKTAPIESGLTLTLRKAERTFGANSSLYLRGNEIKR